MRRAAVLVVIIALDATLTITLFYAGVLAVQWVAERLVAVYP